MRTLAVRERNTAIIIPAKEQAKTTQWDTLTRNIKAACTHLGYVYLMNVHVEHKRLSYPNCLVIIFEKAPRY